MSDLYWREPAKSNVINMNGQVVTEAMIRFCVGFGTAIGQKVKLTNIGRPLMSPEEWAARERLFDWYGI
jgi:hypothetical protein